MNHRADKLVILAAGLGTRMRRREEAATLDDAQSQAADTGLKAMIPIDRPFLDYVLHEAAEAGLRQVCLVIGPEHDALRRYYGEQLKAKRLSFTFAVQHERRGTAHALACAESFAGDDPFVMINSDNLYPREALAALVEANGPAAAVFSRRAMIERSNISADRIAAYAIVQTSSDGALQRVIEKPDEVTCGVLGDDAGVSMNCWRFGPTIFRACRSIGPSARGELEITDAVQYCIDDLGERFDVVRCDQPVLDLSRRSDIPAVAARLAGQRCEL